MEDSGEVNTFKLHVLSDAECVINYFSLLEPWESLLPAGFKESLRKQKYKQLVMPLTVAVTLKNI